MNIYHREGMPVGHETVHIGHVSILLMQPSRRLASEIGIVEVLAAGSGREIDDPLWSGEAPAVERTVHREDAGHVAVLRIDQRGRARSGRRESDWAGALVVVLMAVKDDRDAVLLEQRGKHPHVLFRI